MLPARGALPFPKRAGRTVSSPAFGVTLMVIAAAVAVWALRRVRAEATLRVRRRGAARLEREQLERFERYAG
jgi:hypothetical protein